MPSKNCMPEESVARRQVEKELEFEGKLRNR
jgi:hypothetical protein